VILRYFSRGKSIGPLEQFLVARIIPEEITLEIVDAVLWSFLKVSFFYLEHYCTVAQEHLASTPQHFSCGVLSWLETRPLVLP
jgi:hypothetical protein